MTIMNRILVFSISEEERQRISTVLSDAGFSVSAVSSCREAPNRFRAFRPDAAVIVDNAPEVPKLLIRLRKMSLVPFLVIGPYEPHELINVLELGADRYLPQSFSSRELVARVRAVLRLYTKYTGTSPDLTPVENNLRSDNTVSGLTPVEFRLFSCLFNMKGRLMPFQRLILEVWGGKTNLDTLHYHARHLKQKLETDRLCLYRLLSYRGQGYCLCETGTVEKADY